MDSDDPAIISTAHSRYGSSCSTSVKRMRRKPSTASCTVPSGSFSRCCTRTIAPTWWMSLNPTSSADSSSCVATAMWRSTPARSSSSCSERLRPTESGMKIRGKTTVDLSGSTGSREGTAPSTFKAGTSLTFGLSLPRLDLHQLSQSLTAVILAAGHGTRMRSRTPKVLHPICGRPMLDYVLDAVTEAGATGNKASLDPHHAEVAAHLDERGIAPTFQREPRRTAHALQQIPE